MCTVVIDLDIPITAFVFVILLSPSFLTVLLFQNLCFTTIFVVAVLTILPDVSSNALGRWHYRFPYYTKQLNIVTTNALNLEST